MNCASTSTPMNSIAIPIRRVRLIDRGFVAEMAQDQPHADGKRHHQHENRAPAEDVGQAVIDRFGQRAFGRRKAAQQQHQRAKQQRNAEDVELVVERQPALIDFRRFAGFVRAAVCFPASFFGTNGFSRLEALANRGCRRAFRAAPGRSCGCAAAERGTSPGCCREPHCSPAVDSPRPASFRADSGLMPDEPGRFAPNAPPEAAGLSSFLSPPPPKREVRPPKPLLSPPAPPPDDLSSFLSPPPKREPKPPSPPLPLPPEGLLSFLSSPTAAEA